MNYLKMLILMLLLTITGCKKDVDDILISKSGKWDVVGTSVNSTSKEIWTFHENGQLDMGSYIDAFDWVYDKGNNSILLKKCDYTNINCMVNEFFIKKSTRNEQEWVWEEGKPYQVIYKLKRIK